MCMNQGFVCGTCECDINMFCFVFNIRCRGSYLSFFTFSDRLDERGLTMLQAAHWAGKYAVAFSRTSRKSHMTSSLAPPGVRRLESARRARDTISSWWRGGSRMKSTDGTTGTRGVKITPQSAGRGYLANVLRRSSHGTKGGYFTSLLGASMGITQRRLIRVLQARAPTINARLWIQDGMHTS